MAGGEGGAGEDSRAVRVEEKLERAGLLVLAGARASVAVVEFEYGLWENLRSLGEEVTRGEYRHGDYKYVELNDKKRRDLFVAEVRDRVVQRLVFEELTRAVDGWLDDRVYSGRRGKGLVAAVANARRLLRRYEDGYIWRMDVAKCFESMDRRILWGLIGRLGLEPWVMGATGEILRSYHRGIPIGNVTSLVMANIYLNEFDRWVRMESLAVDYMRYGDDALLVFSSRHEAERGRDRAKVFLSKMKLRVNAKGDAIVAAREGLKYLGHVIVSYGRAVDRKTTNRVMERVGVGNLASYKALGLAVSERRRLDYRVFWEVEGFLGGV